MIKVKVPATSANLGPGFDSLGLALTLYNTFTFEETLTGLEIIGSLDEEKDTENLVYTSMMEAFDLMGYIPKGLKIKIESDIPPSRGLGSSASCIIGGIMGANELAGSPWSLEEIFKLATDIEGHPDNIAPALFGGLISSLMDSDESKVYYNKIALAKGLKFVAMIPDFTLSTKKAREVLPEMISHKKAVENVSRVSLLISAFSNGRFDLLKPGLKDHLHQPYRGQLIKGCNELVKKSYEYKALGVYLSGAGPTIMAITYEEDQMFAKKVESYLESMGYDWKVLELSIDFEGAKVIL